MVWWKAVLWGFAALVMIFIMARTIHVNGGRVRSQTEAHRDGALSGVSLIGWIYAIAVSVVWWFIISVGRALKATTLVNCLLHPVFYLLMLACIVGLVIWWKKNGYGVRDFLRFALLTLAFTLAMASEGAMIAHLLASAIWQSVLVSVTWAVFAGAIGFFLVDAMLHYRDKYAEGSDKKAAQVVSWVLRVLFTLIILAILVFGINWKQIGASLKDTGTTVKVQPTETVPPTETAKPKAMEAPKTTKMPKETETPKAEAPVEAETDDDGEFVLSGTDWYDLRHLKVLGGDKADDDDFGPNPLDEILAEKVARGELTVKEISNKTEKELYGLVTAEEIFNKFVEELAKDPIKGAGIMGYYDVIHGTNFLGAFSTELKEHPDALMERINQKALEWLQDEAEYRKVLTAFVATLERSDEMEITYAANGLDDQMYMFGTTPDHIPIVVVMESTDHSGWFLTFRDFIKGTTKLEVSFRINCDFQPTNVSKVAKVTVKPNPNNPPATGGGGGTPSTGGGGTPSTGGGGTPSTGGGSTGGGGGGYVPPMTDPKDPRKGANVGSNTGGGPGPNTNNGAGATESKAEKPTTTIHEEIGEYWHDAEELKEPQAEAGDSNKPSTPTPPNAGVDNSGDKGTGSGGADQPSKPAPDVTYQDPKTGATKSFDDEGAGNEWDIGA